MRFQECFITTPVTTYRTIPQPAPGPVTQARAKTQIATITEKATSTRIIAQNLPVKQTSSYWTIRSSLIDNSMYLSTQGLNPVIAVVDKSYSGSDYYFLNEYSVDFTVTKPICYSRVYKGSDWTSNGE